MSLTLTGAPPSETTLEAGGHAKGVAVAIVRENKDDSGMGRVKISFPWHSQPQESYWARVVTPMAGQRRGIFFIPEINDEVLVGFERGDVRFPYVLGSVWNTPDPSPAKNADGNNDIRLIQSRSGHKITINDNSGTPLVQIELSDGKKVTLDNNGIAIDDNNGNTITIQSSGGSISVQAATSLSLKAPQVSIEATGTMSVKSSGTLTVQGSLVSIN